MSTSQQFLVIAGLILLSILALNFFRASDLQYDMKYENEAIITATSLAQSIIEEMTTKAFDEVTIEWKTNHADSLSFEKDFGPDSAETSRDLFDDIDDYHGYTLTDSTMSLGNFTVSVIVNYVERENPDVLSASRTFTKKARISVSNTYLKNQPQFLYAFSY